MAYADLATIQATDPGDPLTAAWCDQARDNEEFLIDPPACNVSASSSQSVNDTTDTILTANTEAFDNDSMHSTVSQTSRITIQTAGRYDFYANVRFAADATDGFRIVRFIVNGTDSHVVASQRSVTVAAIVTQISGSKRLTLAAGEFVEVEVRHDAGAALGVTLVEFSALFVTR